MADTRPRLTVDEARALGEAALRGIGYGSEEARVIADHVIDAALCGYEYSGLAKILNLPEHPRFKAPRRPMTVLRETPVSILFDGGNNVGMFALYHATTAAIAKAESQGFALDRDGHPTRDPRAARLGALLPFGGHKGFGLGLIIQAFGILAGSGYDLDRDNGYLFIVFKPDLLVALDDFKREVSVLIDRVKAVPRQPGVEEIRIPSEHSFRNRARAVIDGIEIDRSVHDALEKLASRG